MFKKRASQGALFTLRAATSRPTTLTGLDYTPHLLSRKVFTVIECDLWRIFAKISIHRKNQPIPYTLKSEII